METVIDYFSRVAEYGWWRVLIEFVLIGLVVYWAVDFLEGTRGERLFRGVIFILFAGVLVLNLVVERFGFERLQYLYKGFLLFVLIIAVAGFQPEIRRVLMRIGQPTFMANSSQDRTKTIEELIAAIKDLSAVQTGAIIVIERKVALGDFIETGVRIDAKVSSELLKTIFKPGTPLHDMAVVITNDRIVAARVQLPLAEADSENGIELGSRHRAAIGTSMACDAAVIVVSEETGIVSIADQGSLVRNITESQLRKYLTETFENISPIAGKLRKFSKKNSAKTDTFSG
ncbi:MAG: TIGR00159 family protein [Phycisphaerae bacterium]|nr:TIGR00159 family protein [Phycisphaerae bacterium]